MNATFKVKSVDGNGLNLMVGTIKRIESTKKQGVCLVVMLGSKGRSSHADPRWKSGQALVRGDVKKLRGKLDALRRAG